MKYLIATLIVFFSTQAFAQEAQELDSSKLTYCQSLYNQLNSVGDGGGYLLDSVGDGGGYTTDSVGDGGGQASDSVGDGGGEQTNSVGDGGGLQNVSYDIFIKHCMQKD